MMIKKILLVVLVLLVLAVPASAQGVARLATVGVDDVTVTVGQEFTVPVWIHGVSNLYGADVRLVYAPAVLQGARVDHGYFLQPDFVVRKGFYGTPPYFARYALTQINPTPPASGSGVLMYVTFRAVAPGTSTLALSGILSDRNGVRLPFVTQGGMVTVVDAEQDR